MGEAEMGDIAIHVFPAIEDRQRRFHDLRGASHMGDDKRSVRIAAGQAVYVHHVCQAPGVNEDGKPVLLGIGKGIGV